MKLNGILSIENDSVLCDLHGKPLTPRDLQDAYNSAVYGHWHKPDKYSPRVVRWESRSGRAVAYDTEDLAFIRGPEGFWASFNYRGASLTKKFPNHVVNQEYLETQYKYYTALLLEQ